MQFVSAALQRVRRELRASDYLYSNLSRLGRSKGIYLPKLQSRLCLEGYPSSGNTFAMRLACGLIAKNEIASHTHAFGSLLRARRMSIPTVLLLRRPEDTISSYCVRFKKEPTWATEEYIDFHSRVVSQPEKLLRLDFEALTTRTHQAVMGLAHVLGVPMTEGRATALEHVTRQEIRADRESQLHSVGADAIGWPTEEKEEKKNRIRETLMASVSWHRCHELYEDVQRKVPSIVFSST